MPEVNCEVKCPGGLASSVTVQMTLNPSRISVPLPGFHGECEASVEAKNFESVRTSLAILGYAQCENFHLDEAIDFSDAQNATFVANYPHSGPIDSFYLQEYKVTGASSAIRGEIEKDSNEQVFYENDCHGGKEVSIELSDSGTFS